MMALVFWAPEVVQLSALALYSGISYWALGAHISTSCSFLRRRYPQSIPDWPEYAVHTITLTIVFCGWILADERQAFPWLVSPGLRDNRTRIPGRARLSCGSRLGAQASGSYERPWCGIHGGGRMAGLRWNSHVFAWSDIP